MTARRAGLRGLYGCWRDTRAVAAIEFALIAPFMIVLAFGMFEAASLVRVSLKLSHTADEMAKIVAQQTNGVNKGIFGTSGSLGDYCKGAAYSLTPYSNASLSAQVVSVTSLAGGAPTLDWESDNACPTTAPVLGGTVAATLSGNYGLTPNAGDSAILVMVKYTYTPVLHYVLGSSWTLSQTAFARPRTGATIPCTGC